MNRLNQLQRSLRTTALLSEKDSASIKGGRRFLTKSVETAYSLYNSLKMAGHDASMSNHNGTYCIEW